MSTVEEAGTGTITLDPVLAFGLVKTAAKTKTWTKDDTSALLLKSLSSLPSERYVFAVLPHTINKPTGVIVSDILVTVRFKCNVDGATIYLVNKEADKSLSENVFVGLRKKGYTDHDYHNTGRTMYIKNVTTGQSKTISPTTEDYIIANAGDIIEATLVLPVDWDVDGEVRFITGDTSRISDIEFMSALDISMRHDGSLTGGTGVTVTFDVYDSDGSTLLGSFEIDGLVSPFSNLNLNYRGRYKWGGERVMEVDDADYDMASDAPDAWMRFEVSDIKVGGNSIADSDIPNLFDKLILSNRIYDTTPAMQAEAKCDIVAAGSKHCQSSDVALPKGASGWKSKLYIDIATKKADALRGKRIEIPVKLYMVM